MKNGREAAARVNHNLISERCASYIQLRCSARYKQYRKLCRARSKIVFDLRPTIPTMKDRYR
jgi:hypothetical protein